MGAGIAQAFASIGSAVTIAETGDPNAVIDRITIGLQQADERRTLGNQTIESILARVSTVAVPADLPTDLDLVVEAVPEVPSVKVDVLAAVESVVRPSTIIATNTSSISVAELGMALDDSTRFIGMHFFNPVPASALVEVVRTGNTAEPAIQCVIEWVEQLGKSHVVVNDSPGFATSRLGVCLGLEAIRMLEEGVADAVSIDRAMELGYRHPMGPLRSTDLVGLDVRLAIAAYLAETLGDRYTPPQLLRDKVERGELGRKTGRGFHSWESKSGSRLNA